MADFHQNLKKKMDKYVHLVYEFTRDFPREEIFGVTSQLRRAVLSVVLNYIEGYARRREKSLLYFLETSYASLKESKYLLHFSLCEGYLKKKNYSQAIKLADDIGAMLWKTIEGVKSKI
jgi:four helix bundle protein